MGLPSSPVRVRQGTVTATVVGPMSTAAMTTKPLRLSDDAARCTHDAA
jgi:hypothetical protein